MIYGLCSKIPLGCFSMTINKIQVAMPLFYCLLMGHQRGHHCL